MPNIQDLLRAARGEQARARHTLESYQARLSHNDNTVRLDSVDEAIMRLRETDARVKELEQVEREDAEIARRASTTVYTPETGAWGETPARDIRASTAHPYDMVARTSEADVYNPGSAQGYDGREPVSFIRDVYSFQVTGDLAARERIERHGAHVERSSEYRSVLQTRAVATSGFAGLVVPQYLVNLAALAVRNGRPFANAMTRLPIPDQGMQFLIPRGTTGASVTSQASENSSVSSTDEVWSNLTVNVGTIAGQQDVSRQSLERGTPGLDQLIYMDLAGAYASELDRQLFVGTGSSGQINGVNGTSGINTASAFGAAVTTTTFYSKVAGQVSAVTSAGSVTGPVRVIVMHPRRWQWLLAAVDSQGRPFITPASQSGYNTLGNVQLPGDNAPESQVNPAAPIVLGTFQGLPVITDANVPTNLGGGSTEDAVFLGNPLHGLLWEDGDGMPRQFRFEQPLGNQLTVKLVAYGYAASTFGRYPSAWGRVGGADSTGANGLQAPTF